MSSTAPGCGVLLLLACVSSGTAAAQSSGSSSDAALRQTQQLLQNPEAREAALRQDDRARAADAEARRVAGSPENLEELYALAAEILEGLSGQAGGDPKKLQELVNEALAHPETFSARLTPAQKARLKSLSERISASGK